MSPRRVDIRAILADPVKRKRLVVGSIIFLQAVEGRDLTQAEAEAVYDRVQVQLARERRGPRGSTSRG